MRCIARKNRVTGILKQAGFFHDSDFPALPVRVIIKTGKLKVGIEGVNSTLATAIRTVVVLAMSWGMVFLTRAQGGMGEISRRSWLFLILSGLATGASWLCYYRALQLGRASQVVSIDKLSVVITLVLAFVFLHEPFTAKSMVGCALVAAGTLFMVL